MLPEARGLWGDDDALSKAMLCLLEQAREPGM
jgi:hypothetical protein